MKELNPVKLPQIPEDVYVRLILHQLYRIAIELYNIFICTYPGESDGKESACHTGDPGAIPGSRRSPGGGHGNPLLAWRIPRTEEPGGLQPMGSQRVGHNLETKQHQQCDILLFSYIYFTSSR